MKNKDKNL